MVSNYNTFHGRGMDISGTTHSVHISLGKVNEINIYICTRKVSAVSLPEIYPQKFKYMYMHGYKT